MSAAKGRRKDNPALTAAVHASRAHQDLWRMVPFADRLTEAERETIDRIAIGEGRHLGEVLGALVSSALELRQLRGDLGRGVRFPRIHDPRRVVF